MVWLKNFLPHKIHLMNRYAKIIMLQAGEQRRMVDEKEKKGAKASKRKSSTLFQWPKNLLFLSLAPYWISHVWIKQKRHSRTKKKKTEHLIEPKNSWRNLALFFFGFLSIAQLIVVICFCLSCLCMYVHVCVCVSCKSCMDEISVTLANKVATWKLIEES